MYTKVQGSGTRKRAGEEERERGTNHEQSNMTICLGDMADNPPDTCFDFSNCTNGACR